MVGKDPSLWYIIQLWWKKKCRHTYEHGKVAWACHCNSVHDGSLHTFWILHVVVCSQSELDYWMLHALSVSTHKWMHGSNKSCNLFITLHCSHEYLLAKCRSNERLHYMPNTTLLHLYKNGNSSHRLAIDMAICNKQTRRSVVSFFLHYSTGEIFISLISTN